METADRVEYRIRPNGDKIAILTAADYDALIAMSDARLAALRQYSGHHSSCGECYRIWVEVETILKAGNTQ